MADPRAQDVRGRTLPEDLNAEAGVLGAMIIHNNTIDVVIPILRPSAFSSARHRRIFDAIVALHQDKSPVDLLSLGSRLEQLKQLDKVGGADYLMEVCDAAVVAANAEHYALMVRARHTSRSLIGAAEQIMSRAYDSADTEQGLLDHSMKLIYEIAEQGMGSQVTALGEILREVFQKIDEMKRGGDRFTGVPTGFHEFDDLTNGLQPGEFIIVAARPSMGKTTLALNIARHVGVQLGKAVAVFSLEMARQQVASNMLCSHARIDAHRLRRGRLPESELKKLSLAVGTLSAAPIFVDDTAGMTPMELRAKARRLRSQNDVQLIIVDYLQLMESPGSENRQQEISRISRHLKGLARELRIPILAAAQLNRGVEDRQGNRPRMSDLRESGSLEQDADVVALLHRPSYYQNEDADSGATELIVAKQRNGPTGKVPLTFLRNYLRFENAASGRDS